jgi:SOS-response transcriptional repressor LexA
MSEINIPAGFRSIPILDEIPDGNPAEATELHRNEITWPADIASPYDFGYLVQGDFMKEAGIMFLDIVFVKYDAAPKAGDTFLYSLSGQVKLGVVSKKKRSYVFAPANKDFSPDVVSATSPKLRLIGKVTGVWRPDIESEEDVSA